jgi:hypothetical protein
MSVEALHPLSGMDVLAGLEGVVYATDLNGRISLVAQPGWGRFAQENGAAALVNERSVIGADLLELISGPTVQRVYRTIHDDIVSGRRPQVVFTYRCDAPDLERHMRMAISGLSSGGRLVGILYQSQIIQALPRPPIDFLVSAPGRTRPQVTPAPDIAVCGFCGDVSLSVEGENVSWISPASFYARNGDAAVRVNHSICPRCDTRLG